VHPYHSRKTDLQPPLDQRVWPQLLPQCPNGCGVLAFHHATRTQMAIVGCQACKWELALLPQEARDLTDALIGLNPTLDMTAFLAAVIRNAIAAADADWRIHDEIANSSRDQWRSLVAMTIPLYNEAQQAEQIEDAAAARRDRYQTMLNKLTDCAA